VYKYIRENGGWYEWSMVKIKDFPCNLKCELECEERVEIERIGFENCLNKTIPTRTKKEWRFENKEKKAEYNKKYRAENKEKIKQYRDKNKDRIVEYHKKYHDENKEKITEQAKKYRAENKEKISERKKQYNAKNKDKIRERSKEKIQCECGSIVRRSGLARHKRSKKHQKLMDAL
jgi:hypothetical protein